ncbi:MAG: HAD hydrolase family protein [Planctomycetes bacterium]|nr:HAD hydrolase family protein [Planctomycetota bacterium]
MRFRVLALDFDGTIALDGRLDPEVAAVLAELRAEGLVSLLVTGRILNDLRCRLGNLRAFDAVVAEEGAVVAFPRSGTSRRLAPPPPSALLEALGARRLPFLAGQCLVECEAALAPAVLALIRELELPLVIHFNRGRMMILPQATSKATGLREALRTLRLSAHDALAIGDAENDHQLLEACELGLAVGWGSAALKRVADQVLEGAGPPAVAAYLRAQLRSPERLLPASKRHRLLLGRLEDGSEAFLYVRGRNLLITGDPLSGKSWLAGLLAEQLILQGYSLCIVDPEGDYSELGTLPGMRVLGGADPLPSARELARLFAYPDAGAVIDLSRCSAAEKPAYVSWLLAQLSDLRRRSGLPHRVLIDEAHYFLREPADVARLDLELGGYSLVSYQASRLHPSLLASCRVIFVTRETDPREVQVLRALCANEEVEDTWNGMLGKLEVDQAVLLPGPEEAGQRLLRFRLAPRLTHHVRHEHKYLDAPLAEHLAFRFAPSPRLGERAARSLREFTDVLECAQVAEIDTHLRRGDFSVWVGEVFRDKVLAARLGEMEEQYRLGRLADVNGALIHAVHERYRFGAEPREAALPS